MSNPEWPGQCHSDIERLRNGMIASVWRIMACGTRPCNRGKTWQIVQPWNAGDNNGQRIKKRLAAGHGLSSRSSSVRAS